VAAVGMVVEEREEDWVVVATAAVRAVVEKAVVKEGAVRAAAMVEEATVEVMAEEKEGAPADAKEEGLVVADWEEEGSEAVLAADWAVEAKVAAAMVGAPGKEMKVMADSEEVETEVGLVVVEKAVVVVVPRGACTGTDSGTALDAWRPCCGLHTRRAASPRPPWRQVR
jgi:hypothetical protein